MRGAASEAVRQGETLSHAAVCWVPLLPPLESLQLVGKVWRCMFYCAGCNNKAAAGDVSRSGSWRVAFLTTEKSRPQSDELIIPIFFFCCFLSLPLQNYHSLAFISMYTCLSFRYRHTVSLGSVAITCSFCKPPQSLEATKGCADCKSNFCNECFKLYHPWGTPRAQHEHILPTNNFRPKVGLCFYLRTWYKVASLPVN